MKRPSVETTGFEAFQPSWSLNVVRRVKSRPVPSRRSFQMSMLRKLAGSPNARDWWSLSTQAYAAVGEDALDLVVEADRGRLVDALAGREVDRPDARAALRLVAGVGELAVVVEEVLGLEVAARPVAREDDPLGAAARASRPDGSRSATTIRRLALGDRVVLLVADGEGDLRRSLRDGRALDHPAAELDGTRARLPAQEPQLVVPRAAAAERPRTARGRSAGSPSSAGA